MTAFPTGNLARDGAIVAVLRELIEQGEPTYQTAATACNRYGSSFGGLGQDEYDEAMATMVTTSESVELPPGAVAEQSSDSNREQLSPADTEPARSADGPAEPSMTLDEARAVLNDWQAKLHRAKQDAEVKRREQQTARQKLVEAVNYFLTGGVTISREQLQRDHIASEQARKANQSSARRAPPPSHGPSVYDIGRAGHGNSVNRRYSPTRRGLLPGQRAFSLEGAMARSGSATVDTHGIAAVPAVKSE